MRRWFTGRWSLLWVAISVTSCSNDEPFVGHVSYSRFFEYHDQVREPLCSTLLSLLDQHAQVIGAKVGLRPDPDNPFRYYKFRDVDTFSAVGPCPQGAAGCAHRDIVYSPEYFHAHELAHAYVYRAWGGLSDGFLNEGVAVVLSCEPFYTLQPRQTPAEVMGTIGWRDLLGLRDWNEGYSAAGFFVTYLVERHGWQSVEALYRRVPPGAGEAGFAAAFAQVYETSVDEAWDEAFATPGAAPCQKDWGCIATAMSVGEVAAPDCDGVMHRRVDVDVPGGVELSTEGDDTYLRLLSCTDPSPTSYVFGPARVGQPATHWASLPRGAYTMFGDPLPHRVELRGRFEGSVVGDTCDSASTVSLDTGGRTYVDLLVGSFTGWTRLVGGGLSYDVSPYNLSGGAAAQALVICDSCAPAAACVPLSQAETTRVVVGDQSVVRFENVVAFPPVWAAWGQLIFDVASS